MQASVSARVPAFLLLIVVINASYLLTIAAAPVLAKDAAAGTSKQVEQCPGVSAAACGLQCQKYLCEVLSVFYRSSFNSSEPWDNQEGWQLTTSMPCSRIVGDQPRRRPSYCSWFGITCCTPEFLALGNCSVVNTVSALRLPVNKLNVSLSDEDFVTSIQQLHACGLTVLDLEANQLSGHISPKFGTLVNLTVINIANSWVEGAIPDTLSKLKKLTTINLSNNFLSGTLPEWLGELTELRVLNMGTQTGATEDQGLGGFIPDSLGNLVHLRELVLEANSITGTIPPSLCQGGENNSIVLLNIRANQLTGPATAVEDCGNLVQLDISGNQFDGRLPASTLWELLSTYQAYSNAFTGTLPTNLMYSRILTVLDVSGNQLTGPIPNQITLLSSMKSLYLADNRLTGTITEDVYYLPSLKRVDLSNNLFNGTIPGHAIGYPFGMLELDYTNNTAMTGVIPPQIGFLPVLQKTSILGTGMSCAGHFEPSCESVNTSCTGVHRCEEAELLPCFLRFSDYTVPRDDNSNMRCKYVIRKPPQAAKADCAHPAGPFTLGEEAASLPDIYRDSVQQQWLIEPTYFQYRGCSCLQGYSESWSRNGTKLVCIEQPNADKRITILVGSISGVVGLALLCAVLVLALLYFRMRPRWLRERIMQFKRMKGVPKCARPGDKLEVSIVVTDIKDFSSLTQQYPDLMIKAMGGHNNIMRKACHNHAGYVLDQEGDSWTVAFAEAEDAVAFSLQVQQALTRKAWAARMSDCAPGPHGLDLMHVDNLRREGFSAMSTLNSEGSELAPMAPQLSCPSTNSASYQSFASSAATGGGATAAKSSSVGQLVLPNGLQAQQHAGPVAHNSSQLPGALHSGLASQSFTSTGAGGLVGGGALSGSGTAGGPGSVAGSVELQAAYSEGSKTGNAFARMLVGLRPAGGPGYGHGNELLEDAVVRDRSTTTSYGSALTSNAFGPSETKAISFGLMSASSVSGRHSSIEGSSATKLRGVTSALMHRFSQFARSTSGAGMPAASAVAHHPSMKVLRLSVRIGIATGLLPYGVDVSNSAVACRAKELVSDVAAGGQVLMDETTFKIIKDSLSVLGTVNESGYDDSSLQQLKKQQVVGNLQRQVACHSCPSIARRTTSFTESLSDKDPQDYDHDALVVHMGCFDVPDAPVDAVASRPAAPRLVRRQQQQQQGSTDQQQQQQQQNINQQELKQEARQQSPSPLESYRQRRERRRSAAVAASAAAASQPADEASGDGTGTDEDVEVVVGPRGSRAMRCNRTRQKLHLYSIAAPGMRRRPEMTQDLSRVLGWAEPVKMKPGWKQIQKGYFEAPAAGKMDLTPSAQLQGQAAAPLPDVTMVFISVEGAAGFLSRHNRNEIHILHKAIVACMSRHLDALPQHDGYICKAQEAELKYMVAFEQATHAVQWCLLVQEAMMYAHLPASILADAAFAPVISAETRLPLFRGPRLRMGLAEGQPNSVLPDHAGRANYYGGSVNRAARFMDAAAQGGQVVTNLELLRKLMMDWVAQDREPEPVAELPTVDFQHRNTLDAIDSTEVDSSLLHSQQTDRYMQLQPLHPLEEDQGSLRRSRRRQRPGADQNQQLLSLLPIRSNSETSVQSRTTDNDRHHFTDDLSLPRSASGTDCFVSGSYAVTASGDSFDRRGRQLQRLLQQRSLLSFSGRSSSSRSGVMLDSLNLTTRSKSYSGGRLSPSEWQQQQQQLNDGRSSSILLPLPFLVQQSVGLSDVVYATVSALHLGKFRFKGSGDFQMVHVQDTSLEGREFAAEPPKGKGERMDQQLSGPVKDLPNVQLRLPAALVAARRTFLLSRDIAKVW